jgi:hypothetical protein
MVVKGFLPFVVSPAYPATPLMAAVPAGVRYKVTAINVVNRTAAPHTFALFVVPLGGAPVDDSGCFAPDLVLNGKQAYTVPNREGLLLEPGDELYGMADAATALAFQISYAVCRPGPV